MASRRISDETPKSRRPPATTPEARENQLIALAYDAVEKKIRRGEASSQELTHFLKLGSTRERREQRRIELEAEVLQKKIETMESAQRVEELYETALNAMRSYAGQEPMDTFDD
jgi:hypothetical protein